MKFFHAQFSRLRYYGYMANKKGAESALSSALTALAERRGHPLSSDTKRVLARYNERLVVARFCSLVTRARASVPKVTEPTNIPSSFSVQSETEFVAETAVLAHQPDEALLVAIQGIYKATADELTASVAPEAADRVL